MKQQWIFIFALVFALIIAVFSVVNVAPVPVNYVFGVAQFPLIMVILGSALTGGFIAGLLATTQMVRQHRSFRSLQRELTAARDALAQAKQEAQAALTAEPEAQAEKESPKDGESSDSTQENVSSTSQETPKQQ